MSPKVRQHAPSLAAALNNRFIVAEVEVEAWKKEHELNEEELLACLIEPASTLARPPISNYHVGYVFQSLLLIYRYCHFFLLEI